MTLHVFSVSWGSLWHEGEFVKRTEKMIFYKTRGGKERRSDAAGRIVIDTDDPASTLAKFKEEWNRHKEKIADTDKLLSDLRKAQLEGAIKAAGYKEVEK